jgi:SP family sugar:H+ symporter-like MFS transporter
MEAAASSQTEETNLFQIILISVIATIGGFLFGFDSGVINGTIDGLSAEFGGNDLVISFSVASMLIGCAVGAMIAGRTADIFGRRGVLIVAAVFLFISAWGSGVATGAAEFVVYRVLGGLAVGAASVLAPAYISEITPAHIRGRLSSIQQVAIIVGLTAAFMSNYVLAGTAGSSVSEFWLGFEAWRWMFWIEMVPAAIFFVALFMIPESPRFLVIKDRDEQARSVLVRLFGDSAGGAKLDEIKSTIATDHKPRMSDLFDKGKVRPIVWVGIGLAVFQQLVGINVVFYYGAVLWQSVGFTEDNALLINVIMGVVSIGAVMIALAVIDKIGRKPLKPLGFDCRRIENSTDDKANLWARIGPDTDGGLVMSGHTDVVPIDGQDWHTDPFNLTDKDGRLFGRGTSDMKSFIALCLAFAPKFATLNLSKIGIARGRVERDQVFKMTFDN